MITIDIKTLLIYLVLAALVVFIIYLVLLVKKLISTLKELDKTLGEVDTTLGKTDKILDDTGVVTGIAADKAVQLDGAITDVTSFVSGVTEEANGKQGLIKTGINVGKAAASTASYFKEKKEKEEEKEFKEYKKAKKAEKNAEKKAGK